MIVASFIKIDPKFENMKSLQPVRRGRLTKYGQNSLFQLSTRVSDLWGLIYTYNIKICKIHKISLGEHVDHHHHWMYKVGRIRHPGQGHQSTPRQD